MTVVVAGRGCTVCTVVGADWLYPVGTACPKGGGGGPVPWTGYWWTIPGGACVYPGGGPSAGGG